MERTILFFNTPDLINPYLSNYPVGLSSKLADAFDSDVVTRECCF